MIRLHAMFTSCHHRRLLEAACPARRTVWSLANGYKSFQLARIERLLRDPLDALGVFTASPGNTRLAALRGTLC